MITRFVAIRWVKDLYEEDGQTVIGENLYRKIEERLFSVFPPEEMIEELAKDCEFVTVEQRFMRDIPSGR